MDDVNTNKYLGSQLDARAGSNQRFHVK